MRGLTLIETVIYIALFAFLMTGAVLATYQIATNSTALDAKTTTVDEGVFISEKIETALTRTATLIRPNASTPYSPVLELVTVEGTHLRIQRTSEGRVVLSENGGATYLPLASENASTTGLLFEYLPGSPEGVEASTTINDETFLVHRYLRP